MRVLVKRVEAGVSEIMIVPGRKFRLPPTVIRGTDPAKVYEEAVAALTIIKGPPQLPLPE